MLRCSGREPKEVPTPKPRSGRSLIIDGFLGTILNYENEYLITLTTYQFFKNSTSIGCVEQWSFSNKEAVSEHLKTCPFNVRTSHKDPRKMNAPEEWPQVMKALEKRLEAKRQSAWFIK